jgi:folate-binding protein YgfZ
MFTFAEPRGLGFSWTARRLSGPDARDFLHRLTTVNARALEPGMHGARASWGFILTATGKVRAAFLVSCTGPDEFLLEYDAGPGREWDRALVESIEQYTFAERQELSSPLEQSCLWIFGALPAGLESSGCLVVDHGALDFGRPWWTVWGAADRLAAVQALARPGEAGVAAAQLEEWRMQAVRPWFSRELGFDVMPLEVGLLDGIAQGKGCYPGQEVIERILTQGAPPRRLARLRAADGRIRLSMVRKNEAQAGSVTRLEDGSEWTVEQCAAV